MIEEKISRKLAVLAKEIGFGGKGMTSDWSYIDGVDRVVMLPSNNKSPLASKNTFSAPTQSLYQRYLREMWGVHAAADCNGSGWFWVLETTNGATIEAFDLLKNETGHYETYEAALDVAMIRATNHVLEIKMLADV